jgi:thiamine-monophosphate kinase
MKRKERLGERKIIEIIQSQLELMPKMPIPFGDDVSAYDIGNGHLAVLKTDMLVGKTDVPPGMNLWQAARKAVVMNISDFAAKGVEPKTILVSLGLPRKLTSNDVKEIGRGLNAGAREYGAYVIGGDTGEASDLVISISLLGIAERGQVMLRSGAGPEDIVAVTGSFGKTASGLRILVNDIELQPKIREILVESVLMPRARLREGLALGQTKAVTACIDSSDGLAWSLHEISRASQVGLLIDKLPTAVEAEKFAKTSGLDASELTFFGGEEYELVLTVKSKLLGHAEKAVEGIGGKLLPIGKVTTGKRVLLEIDGKRQTVEARGWEHFKSRAFTKTHTYR